MEENINVEINISKVYKCTEYKTLNNYKFFIITNNNYEILKFESLHNHFEENFDGSILIDLYVLNIMQLNPNVTRNINKQLPPEVTKFLMKFPMNQNIIEQ
ncbi:hypothetical protein U3516DRAFT_770667 [Neocallimastix sp. 'constans']